MFQTFVAGHFDSHEGKNYPIVSAGIWQVQSGVLTKVADVPKECPGGDVNPCNGHGTCDESTLTCKCDLTYFGAGCQGKCPDSCGLHGTCNDGSSGDGKCVVSVKSVCLI